MRHRRAAATLVTGILAAGGAAIGVGSLGQADAATPTATGTASTAQHCGAGGAKLPDALREDLRAARQLPAGKRPAALKGVRQKALVGGYGTRAERRAEHRIGHRAGLRARMPEELRSDLKALRTLSAGERSSAREALRAKVLAGGYGDVAQQQAQKGKAHREACRAQRS